MIAKAPPLEITPAISVLFVGFVGVVIKELKTWNHQSDE